MSAINIAYGFFVLSMVVWMGFQVASIIKSTREIKRLKTTQEKLSKATTLEEHRNIMDEFLGIKVIPLIKDDRIRHKTNHCVCTVIDVDNIVKLIVLRVTQDIKNKLPSGQPIGIISFSDYEKDWEKVENGIVRVTKRKTND